MLESKSFDEQFIQIYVASPITHVADQAEQTRTLAECATIIAALVARNQFRELQVAAYDPIHQTPSWQHKDVSGDGTVYQPREIWNIDTKKVLEHADAIIVNGAPGGSTGVGIELAMAFARGLPVLYLHSKESPVTRMVTGMPGFLELAEFDRNQPDPDQLKATVQLWVEEWMPLLAIGPQRRAETADRFSSLHAKLVRVWTNLDERDSVVDKVQLNEDSIEHYIRTPLRLASMPADKLYLLTEMLNTGGVVNLRKSDNASRLDGPMLEALDSARDGFEWGTDFTAAVKASAERYLQGRDNFERTTELMQRRKFNFVQPGDWLRFAEAWQTGDLP